MAQGRRVDTIKIFELGRVLLAVVMVVRCRMFYFLPTTQLATLEVSPYNTIGVEMQMKMRSFEVCEVYGDHSESLSIDVIVI